ncbi:DUF6286 domain-containing protein [Nonomuraea jiangxiensis]|uniref:DUF6286 domain-containing protein n=1 Tax=Nonomuraea jiangxiensis TaxID=633440 RepID=A0A1G8ZJJ0_9ACTN|nr:DUF6286 domain-containing protein [Nonomuraea jiangxiensis]SDK14300.1 hypothetical protein SAMN05421869_11473 [Nonomuraea jiangxiensis]
MTTRDSDADRDRQEVCAVPPERENAPESEGARQATDTEQAEGAYRAELPRRDRGADRAVRRMFRPYRRIPAVVVAVLLTLLGLLVAAETISTLVGRPLFVVPYDRLLAWASTTPWANPLVALVSAIVALVGLALLATALVPGRPTMMPVRSRDPDLAVGLRPRSVTRTLAHAAEEVPGVRSARVRMRRHTVTVTPVTSGWDEPEVRQAVRQAVLDRLAGLDLVEPYRVVVGGKERR